LLHDTADAPRATLGDKRTALRPSSQQSQDRAVPGSIALCAVSKLARSVLRHIRVASKQELKDRIMAAMDYFNQEPVVHNKQLSGLEMAANVDVAP
jgi:hypothetical protein